LSQARRPCNHAVTCEPVTPPSVCTGSLELVDILGVPVHAGTFEAALSEVSRWVEHRTRSYAIFRDVHGLMEAQRQPNVFAAHRSAGLVACDGVPLVWASRRAGVSHAERVYGPDFMRAFCTRATERGWSSFLFGGKAGVAEALSRRLRDRLPGLQIAGTLSPPFRAPTPAEDAEMVDKINASGADIVWVGLSTPKQELWMAQHVGRLEAPALLGVGAAFDFLSGGVRQAPRWVQQAGLEWSFRIAMDPRRLFMRYMRNNPAFIAAFVRRPPQRIAIREAMARAQGRLGHH
jgi:N-acetylglucosaminyldiphosphoundecaprenol N-acetyl-beta-D-mannosaminyltransferase